MFMLAVVLPRLINIVIGLNKPTYNLFSNQLMTAKAQTNHNVVHVTFPAFFRLWSPAAHRYMFSRFSQATRFPALCIPGGVSFRSLTATLTV